MHMGYRSHQKELSTLYFFKFFILLVNTLIVFLQFLKYMGFLIVNMENSDMHFNQMPNAKDYKCCWNTTRFVLLVANPPVNTQIIKYYSIKMQLKQRQNCFANFNSPRNP